MKEGIKKSQHFNLQQFIFGFQKYKCMVLYDHHDILPFLLACVNLTIDYKLGLIWHQNNFTGLLFLNI